MFKQVIKHLKVSLDQNILQCIFNRAVVSRQLLNHTLFKHCGFVNM